ncbi:DUF1501 domain-containing protein [Paraburkholderia solisilvae]|uniref:Twin-arginine translocation pathway signal sequence domain-containing protein n=1 Tax=Paraburkholderia solisilvae TaxID=624376 RepID=A0A6J5DVL8_9BURK|nr:DUF1501 domain-containing protein [Paraburkholderia solisilvae]CAB3757687.1 hypothetical protein LMG29739_02752 [Paraburkholderia solisilvae]
MKRREFLSTAAAAGAALSLPRVSCGAASASAASTARRDFGFAHRVSPAASPSPSGIRLLILIELKGGNDGLNTVVPFADPLYFRLRPGLAMRRDAVLPLDERSALHPALQPLMPLWQSGQLAIVQGLGYPQFNLSHFRAMEIWDTASDAQQYLREGWIARASAAAPQGGAMNGAAGGANLMFSHAGRGPLAGAACRALTSMPPAHDAASVELAARPLNTLFPSDAFGSSLRLATQAIAAASRAERCAAAGGNPAVVRVTLNGFDTHANQRQRHAMLLAQFAHGVVALRAALRELGRWDDALVLTCSEFGRRPRENDSGGTEHGTSAPHFVMGGRVRGGLYGAPPALSQLDGNGNLPMSVDFRCLYASVLAHGWRCDAAAVLGRRFDTLPLWRV